MKRFCFIFLLMLFYPVVMFSQTTGKISGRVIDKATGEALPSAQILIYEKWDGNKIIKLNRIIGAVADNDGNYFIINLPPGRYNIKAQMIGYKTQVVKEVEVAVNRTTNVNFELDVTEIHGDEVVVFANKIDIKKDQTGSIKNISSDKLSTLPVENVQDVIKMQSGVVDKHFRGGRLSDVTYLVDGVAVDDAFTKEKQDLEINNDVISNIEVITGTFNAEYGRAMSGVVNIVTKNGNNNFGFKANILAGNYFTANKDVFIGLKNTEITRDLDLNLFLEGPVIKDKINFIINTRYNYDKGYLNGIRRFNVDDYSNFLYQDSSLWYSEHTGDNKFVPLNFNKLFNFFTKLSFNFFDNFKLSLNYTGTYNKYKNYNHLFKYNPDGMLTNYNNSQMVAVLINHSIAPFLFYEFKVSYLDNYRGAYVYENPLDKRYAHDAYLVRSGPDFYTGGQDKSHLIRKTFKTDVKYDITYQLTNNHSIKTGFLFTKYHLKNKDYYILNKYRGTKDEYYHYFDDTINKYVFPNYEPVLPEDTNSIYSDLYDVEPKEISYYFQDKMEFNEIVVNLGVRYDGFDPNSYYPSQWRNPANQLRFPDNPEKMSTLLKAPYQWQLSPRFGISYQLGTKAVAHISYGHFFQVPPFYALYKNHNYRVAPNDYSTVMGNPTIKSEKTVQYEIGLWQEIFTGFNLDVVLYYRDIYDLLSTKIVTTFNQIRYGLYCNKDYGNVKGFEVKVDYDLTKNLFLTLNYTLQYTKGVADNPLETFTRAGNSMDPISQLIPLEWDQRHTLNFLVEYVTKKFNAGLIFYYNSGMPYTWVPILESHLATINLLPNNSWRPSNYRFDLNISYNIDIWNKLSTVLYLKAYNLLDRKNEKRVNQYTGRAYTTIVRPEIINAHRSNFNDYMDIYRDPSMYGMPRFIKFGIGIKF